LLDKKATSGARSLVAYTIASAMAIHELLSPKALKKKGVA
jgi:hypothetical protein